MNIDTSDLALILYYDFLILLSLDLIKEIGKPIWEVPDARLVG